MFGTFRWYNNCPKMFSKSQNGFIRKFANKRTDTANPVMKRTKIKISDGIYAIHVFILLFVCAPFVGGENYQDCEVNGVYKACSAQPQILNFSRSQNNYSIRVDPPNYTCGTPSAPFYRLGDSIDKRQVCDASDEALKHPVEYMVDKNDASWWQSITWPLNDFDMSSRFKINITLSFNKVYQLTGDMTITFNSGRPSQMILEKSTDYGKTWTALQYYARSCETTFKDVPRVIPSTKLDEVICVSKFSGPSSSNLPGQQVKFEVYQDRLKMFLGSLGTNYTNLYTNIDGTNLVNFLTFTDLRIRLLYPATDAKEFSRNFFDFLHYYYAISGISILTECFCNLHGASCLFDDIGIKCACKHNTDGRECERCLPLYNNRPWKAGLYAPFPSGTANECQKCECNDHAESCVYNATLTKGVCQNCTNNTRGDQCELCVEGFFPNTSLPLNHTERCVECSCESLGVINVNSSCIQETTNGKNPGQCDCKPLVTGLRCEYCQPEYYGLLIPDNNPGTCKECNCDTDGTVNNSKVCNQADGQCPCKPSTGSRRCDICKEGYFQFPKNNPSKGCLECGCDPGTSVTKSCDKTSGKCKCKDHVSGDKCSDIDKNFYVPAWDELILQPLGAPSLDCTLDDDLWTEERPFDGNEFATCPLAKDVTLKFASVPVNRAQKDIEWPFHVGIRYSLSTPDALEGAVVVVEAEGNSGYDVSKMASQKNISIDSACPVANGHVANITIEILPGVSTASVVINETVSLDLRCKYTLSLKFPGKINSTDNITIDSALLIPALTKMNSSVVMDSLRAYNESTNQAETLQTYNTCVGEMSGLLVRNTTMYKDNCRSLLRAVGGELNNEVTSCGCSTTGSVVGTVCDPIGGQCNCKSGVGGRKCDRCLSGYYNFTLNGCERCPMRICPIIATTTPLPVTSSSTAKDSSALVMVEQNFLGIYLGIGVGILLIPLIILICYCCTKRRQKVSLNDDTVPRKNVNRYEFNENLAMGNRKAKKQVGFNDRLSLVGSPSVRVNQFGWTQHDTDDTGDLDSIPEETSSAEDDDVILPYYYNSIPKPSNVRNTKTVNVDAAAVKVDNKHANMPGTPNGSVPSTHFNTFKGETPISVPEMYMDTKREKPPEKPKRKNLAKKQEENTMPPLRASKVNLKSKTMEYVYPNDYPPRTSSKSERVSRDNPAFNQAMGPQLRANRPHEKPPRTPSRRIDLFNKGMDANHPKEELLPSSNKVHLYADYACNCKTGGSKNGACDRFNGQCSCKANVAINGQNDTTGNTSSRYCSACQTNFYGYGTPEGCRPCDCHKDGSTAEQCADDGQCPCKATIGGRKCDVCQPKYFQFSANGCITCNCSSNGSTTGACNISTGVCECKENVNGDKCESCKPGYFNLRPENSKGCQPCFCFGHGSTCTSANGYSPMNLTVTGSEKFAPVNGMYTAPPSFLGDRHWSYGQMLSFVIQNSGAEISLQNTTLVTFYNKELKMTYSPKEALTVNQTAMTVVIPMFEWDWIFNDSMASAEQFYKILANVSAIHIPESINGTKVAITDLKLTTAMKVEGNGTATFVEQCTCEAASSTSGSSCERCAEGSRRPNFYNDDSFSTCTKCNCSERGATNPPTCDEWNGKCLNCRNGTMGDFCESCADNVTGTNCDTCLPNFYGLDLNGCKYCDCDKVGATGQDCNKTTGQCTCAPNVTGRRCDQCEDNYHDLKSTGCTQCNECYNLVQTEVKQLREQRDNLTKEIDRLRSNDMNSKPGVFTMKIDKTKSDINKLTNFLTSALNSESELQSKIEAFTKHIDESATKVQKVENESQPQIETNLQQGDTMLQKALDNKHRVDVTVKDIKFLTDPVVQQAEKLDLLTESLKSAQSNFVSFTSNTTSGLSSILKTVETLENVTTEANTAANKVLADVETARTQHQNNTQQISGLVTKASQLTATSTNAMSEAKDARNTSQLVFNKTMQLKNESANVEGFNPDIASYTTRITSTKTKRDSLQSQVTTEQNSLKSRQENLTKAINESKLMLEEARSHQSEVNTLVVSVSNAERKANEAKTSEETIFKEAENMLETMKNFGDRRKVVEEKSNSSLQMVHDVEKVSQSVIMEAGNLSAALTQAQQSSATGKEAAIQAYNLIKQKLDSLKPVGEKAKLVLEMAKTQLTDVESKAGVPKSTNATIIPLSTTCDGFTTQLTDLQTRADKALERAQNLTTIGKTTTDRLNKLLAQIESVGEVDVTADTTRLATLSTGVSAARTELTSLSLSASLTSIKQALANQVTSLQNFKTKKADLEKKINYLKRLNDQVRAI